MDLRELAEAIILTNEVEEGEEEGSNEEPMGLVQSACKTKKKRTNKGKAQNAQQQKDGGQIGQSARSNPVERGKGDAFQGEKAGEGPNVAKEEEMKGGARRPTNLGSVEMAQQKRCHNPLLLASIPPITGCSPLPPSTRRHSSFLPPKSPRSPDPPPSPSAAVSTFVISSWRRNSAKNRGGGGSNSPGGEIGQIQQQQKEEGGSCTSGEGNGPHLLSELSQEMLAQIIRLFPFPQPPVDDIDRPKICRTLSQPTALVSMPKSPRKEEAAIGKMVAIEISKTAGENCDKRMATFSPPPPSTPSSTPCPVLPIHPLECASAQKTASIQGPFERLRRAASNLSGGSNRERPKNLRIFGGQAGASGGGGGKANNKKNGALSRLCRVSVETMAITALPLDCWLKERLKNWVQLSGHQGTIVPASNHSLWKKQPPGNSSEALAYGEIMRDPILSGITPKFFREIQHRNEAFIEIQDLLAEFPNTSSRAVMDIKIGTRTFLESEVANRGRRADLYRKMVELAPDEPSQEEHREGAITKLRYMQFRERKSSSATLGFRIEAAQLPGGVLRKDFKRLSTRPQVRQALMDFFGPRREALKAQLLARLKQIRDAVEASEFFARHEVVGSSLLLIYDEKKAGAWLIDFAKCTKMEEGGGRLSHRREWALGNHEDGYLTGLDNLVELMGGAERGNDGQIGGGEMGEMVPGEEEEENEGK